MSYRFSKSARFFLEAIAVGLVVGLLLIVWQSHSGNGARDSYATAVNRAAPSVVNIYTTRTVARRQPNSRLAPFFHGPNRQRLLASLGSGVIVSSDGYILTSYHVIKQADAILVALMDGREAKADIVGTDPATDLALLHIDIDNLPAMQFSLDDPVQVGDVVLAIGNPLGIGQSVSMGIVGATGRSHLGIATFENFIQTDAVITPGNSGGALVDTEGDLVGINTAILSNDGRWQGIGFATPASMAREVMQDLIAYGHVIRGYLGVSVRNTGAELVARFGKKVAKGALVTGVMRGSPAAQGGIRPGDILIGMNGEPFQSGYDAMNRVAGMRPSTKVEVEVMRLGQLLDLNITIGERPIALDH